MALQSLGSWLQAIICNALVRIGIFPLCHHANKVRVLPRGAGLTLLEVAVSVGLVALSGPAITGALVGTMTATELSNARTTSAVLTEAQLDSVAAQIFRNDGNYALLPDIPANFELSLQVRELRPGILQEITATVKHPPGEKRDTITTYHSNRLLEIGTRPQAAGLEGTRPLSFPVELGPSSGVFQVVNIPATDLPGGLGGRWQLQATPPAGLATERRTMSVSIFRGTPFGPGPQGTAVTPPKQVAGTLLSSVRSTDLVAEAAAPKAAADAYTLYFFNEGATAIQTYRVEVTCICPG